MWTQFTHKFEDIASVENLLEAWREFIRCKHKKHDVQEFQLQLMDNIFSLHNDLINHIYRHGGYQAFNISDPKPRNIHKASVRDRLSHHAVYRILYPFFDGTFIADSYSCRIDKGTHKALNRFREFAYRVSQNHTRTCWVLKCDVEKFFASIDHEILLMILRQYLTDADILWLLEQVIRSFSSTEASKGLPLGNLTSQLLVNIYLNEFDQFVKHTLKARYYIRYADDFVILSEKRNWLEQYIPYVQIFLSERLALKLHPGKIFVKTLASGVDFLGWVYFPDHRLLRRATKKRMMRRLGEHKSPETLNSYLGLLAHGNTYKVKTEALRIYANADHYPDL